ncbi:MAG: hypothetical protein QS721_09255 [Candidatus Endonucleobacter sp. (ex Gigantidas childressi)]|nr:hypothetical protein [Candidatus Endonucleobacter sp. (ex Gigantidas childressi)]
MGLFNKLRLFGAQTPVTRVRSKARTNMLHRAKSFCSRTVDRLLNSRLVLQLKKAKGKLRIDRVVMLRRVVPAEAMLASMLLDKSHGTETAKAKSFAKKLEKLASVSNLKINKDAVKHLKENLSFLSDKVDELDTALEDRIKAREQADKDLAAGKLKNVQTYNTGLWSRAVLFAGSREAYEMMRNKQDRVLIDAIREVRGRAEGEYDEFPDEEGMRKLFIAVKDHLKDRITKSVNEFHALKEKYNTTNNRVLKQDQDKMNKLIVMAHVAGFLTSNIQGSTDGSQNMQLRQWFYCNGDEIGYSNMRSDLDALDGMLPILLQEEARGKGQLGTIEI